MATRAGDVAVRFSVENAEVVRKALEALGRDGEKALKVLDAAGKPVPKGLSAVSEAIAAARGQAQSFAGHLGPLGTAVAALGPIGLATAGVVGGLAVAMSYAADADKEQREDAQLLVSGATTFDRNHPMTAALAAGMDWSSAQVNDLWSLAAQL